MKKFLVNLFGKSIWVIMTLIIIVAYIILSPFILIATIEDKINRF